MPGKIPVNLGVCNQDVAPYFLFYNTGHGYLLNQFLSVARQCKAFPANGLLKHLIRHGILGLYAFYGPVHVLVSGRNAYLPCLLDLQSRINHTFKEDHLVFLEKFAPVLTLHRLDLIGGLKLHAFIEIAPGYDLLIDYGHYLIKQNGAIGNSNSA